MLAEHFAAGSMDGGAGDFAAGWEWDNVMMLPGGQQHLNRKLHSAPSSAWSDEPPVMVVAPPRPPPPPAIASGSGIPGISTTAAARNSLLQPPDGAKTDANGLPASIKHESLELPRSGKPNGVIHHPSSQEKLPSNSSKDFFLGLSGGGKPEGDKNDNGGAASGDAEIGLKLGLKRAFSPDSNSVATSSAGGATTVSASAPTAATTNATNTGNKSSSPGKKPRAANHTPRCQVEGCKTDLTSAKDYHRRHKVCAMHSKSAKVSVNSIEQRFCQQCSRFHVLSEFDEGKRSCRRRLAGHNERRRKPQPDPMALTSVLSPYQAGFMRLARDERLLGYGTPLSYLGVDNVNGKLAWPRFGTLDEHPGLVSGSSSVSRPERFFMLIPPRKTPAMLSNGGAMGHQQQQQQQQQHHHHGVHQFMQGTGSMGQNLTLSSPSAYATGIGIGPPNPAAGSSPHGVNVAGVSDSGRALSLLSSQSWTASPSPHDSMEQLMSENRAAYSSSQQQQPGTSYVSLSQQQVAQVAALDSRNGNHQSQQQQQQGGSGGGSGGGGGGGASFLPGMNSYENHTVLTLLQESELRNLQDQQQQQQQQHARPTIDLMHMSTTPPASAVVIQQQQQQQQSPSDFQVLKPYGSGLYDPHHL